MPSDDTGPAAVSRRIEAPASVIFDLLADPTRHIEIDGSGMLRGAATEGTVTGLGDVFAMKMRHPEIGDYQMNNRVVEFESGRRISWEPAPGLGHPLDINLQTPVGPWPGYQWSYELTPDGDRATVVTESFDCSRASEELREAVNGGQAWIEAMTRSLELLDGLCAAAGGPGEGGGDAA
jgi:RNA polymerase sigma-70 factor, ECF subfamily